jgi:hypothetical protein
MGLSEGNSMNDRLENLRMAFPAEVTAAFLAAQKLLGPFNYDFAMMAFLLLLVVINLAIYYHLYAVRSWWLLAYISVGFFLWAVSIDSERLKDLLLISYYPTFPLLLVLYTLTSGFVSLPKPKQANPETRG